MKKIYILGILLITLFSLTGCSFLEKNKNSNKTDNVTESENGSDVTLSEEDSDENPYISNLFTVLSNYGYEIYDKQQYSSYSKENDMYFISLNQLKKDFSYEISSFKGEDGTVCDKNKSGIYFDIDNTLGIEYSEDFKPIFPMLIGCSSEADNSQS